MHKTFTEKGNNIGDVFKTPDDAGSGTNEKKAARIRNRNLKRREKCDDLCQAEETSSGTSRAEIVYLAAGHWAEVGNTGL